MTSAKVSYPTRTREEVIASLSEQVGAFAEQVSIERAVLFGSWARGEQTVASDVDLLVVVSPDIEDRAYRTVKRSVGVRGLEPHVVSTPAYRRRRAHVERMAEDEVLIYDRSQTVSDRGGAVSEAHPAVRFAEPYGVRSRRGLGATVTWGGASTWIRESELVPGRPGAPLHGRELALISGWFNGRAPGGVSHEV